MLQHNATAHAPHDVRRHAHITHAAVVGFHALCCGVPALAMLLTASWGAASGLTALSLWIQPIHDFLHGQEPIILAISGFLVLAGGALELHARRSNKVHGFAWFFAFSLCCFVANVAVIIAHRM
jgi:hypothetical protein